jgi:parvulin-like peptidyl-prolyl isomerase
MTRLPTAWHRLNWMEDGMDVLCAVAFLSVAFGSLTGAQVATQRAVATVNGEELTSAEFMHLAGSLSPQTAARAIDDVLVAQEGRLRGYHLTDEQFANVVQNLWRRNRIESDDQFQASLAQTGLTHAELRRNLEREMIANRLRTAPVGIDVDLDQLRRRANIVWSDDNLRQLYEQGLRLRR